MVIMKGLKVFVCVCFIVAAVHIRDSNALVEPLEYLPSDLQDNLNLCHSSGDFTQQSARTVFWLSINQFCTKFEESRPDLTPQQRSYLRSCLAEAFAPFNPASGGRVKRQATLAVRTRQEIRTMSEPQRRRFYRAINGMKTNTLLWPNVYDFLADYHTGENIGRAHTGPAFLPWHRTYLWIFEFFLRLEDPSVTLPYWSSSLETDIDLTQSVIWHPSFLGNGDGARHNGPFINTTFTRNVQNIGVMTWEGIDTVLSHLYLANISVPTARPDSNLETLHGPPHMAVGGSMSSLQFAARDPIFYMHHAFVDSIWSRFRSNQRRNGIDPGEDYPFVEGDPRYRSQHNPNAIAGFANLTNASTWTQRFGISNLFDHYVRYRPVPECPCNSRYLRCDRRQRRCVSLTIGELRTADLISGNSVLRGRRKRQAVFPSMSPPQDVSYGVCPKRSFLNDIDTRKLNLVEGMPNSNNEWSYISVKVVSKRAMEYHEFEKYSLYNQGMNSQFRGKDDLYKPGIQKKYQKCEENQDAVGKITLVSHGLNYHGHAEEYVIIDNRLAVAEAKGVIPVKKPTSSNPTEAIIAAFDSCGRVCTPYLRKGTSGAMVTDGYFSGGIRVSQAAPQQYSSSYREALLDMWNVPSQSSCPSVNYDNIPISFFCEFTERWLWGPVNNMAGGGQGIADRGRESHMRPLPGFQPDTGHGINTGWQGTRIRPGHEPEVGLELESPRGHRTRIGSRRRPSMRGGRVNGGRRRHIDRTSSRGRITPRKPPHRSGISPIRGSSGSVSVYRGSSRPLSPFGGTSGSILPTSGRYIGRRI